MKKFLFVSLAFGILLVFGLIFYGAYLNKAGETQIAEVMADQRIPVRVAKVAHREMSPRVLFPVLRFYTEKMTDAVTLVSGNIDQVFVKKNDFVQAGQVICTVVDDEMPLKIRQAETAIKSAEAKVKATENKYERYQRLWEKKATSLSSVEEAELDYNTAVASLEDAQAKLDQLLVQKSYMEVTAPISGNIITEYKNAGTHVDAGTPIFMIADFNELFCDVTVPDRIAKDFTVDSTSIFQFQDNASSRFYDDTGRNVGAYINDDGFSMVAVVQKITPSMSEPSEQRKITWRFDNASKMLESKVYGDVSMKVSKTHRYLMIPLEAVTNRAEPFVFVLDQDDTARVRDVTLGMTDGEYVEILSGLKEGDMVITSVTPYLLNGSKVVLKEVE